MSDTCRRVETIILDHAGLSEFAFNNETDLSGDLQFDSLDLIALAMRVEDEFGIDIPDADVDSPALGTFGGLCAYVEGKLGAHRAA